MEEIWKDVVGFEGLYEVSSKGRIFSIRTNKVLKTCVSNRGYELVCLRDFDGKRKQYTVHRIVAKAFLENKNNCPIINHKDENKLNNSMNNLEWCDYFYNNNYGNSFSKENKTLNSPNRKECWIINLQTKEIKHFNSLKKAADFLKTSPTNLTNVINGKYKQSKGWYVSLSQIDIKNFDCLKYITKHCKTKKNKSGYAGVNYEKRINKYRSALMFNKVRYFLGYYETPEEAYEVYKNKLEELKQTKETK